MGFFQENLGKKIKLHELNISNVLLWTELGFNLTLSFVVSDGGGGVGGSRVCLVAGNTELFLLFPCQFPKTVNGYSPLCEYIDTHIVMILFGTVCVLHSKMSWDYSDLKLLLS